MEFPGTYKRFLFNLAIRERNVFQVIEILKSRNSLTILDHFYQEKDYKLRRY
jgi:hypothetical protein